MVGKPDPLQHARLLVVGHDRDSTSGSGVLGRSQGHGPRLACAAKDQHRRRRTLRHVFVHQPGHKSGCAADVHHHERELMVMDVCGAPALVSRLVHEYVAKGAAPSVLVLGGAGKSGSMSLAAAQDAGAGRRVAVVPNDKEARMLEGIGLADHVVIADARSPLGLSGAVQAAGGPADITVVCVDVPGCEHPAILSTAPGGTVVFFSMATNFAAAALGAEGLAADVRMLVGNGYVPGHADYAVSLLRGNPAVRGLFESRLGTKQTGAS